MAEDFAVVRYKNFTPEDAFDAVAKIEQCIAHAVATGYWEKDTSIAQASGELLLKAKAQSFSPAPAAGNPNDQRIAIQAFAPVAPATDGILKIGYFPFGWDPGAATFNDVVNSSTVSWSGMRNITGTTSGFGALANRVFVGQMRDELTAAAPYPGNSLTILLVGTTVAEIEYAAHVGRVITCSDPFDFGLGLYGDACLTGAPFDIATANGWLKGTFGATTTNDAAVLHAGGNFWHFANVAYDPTALLLDNVNGLKRILPYTVYGTGLARGGTPSSAPGCGIIGQMKYIREVDASYDFFARLRSTTPGSSQVWRAAVYDATIRPQVFLWGAEVEVP